MLFKFSLKLIQTTITITVSFISFQAQLIAQKRLQKLQELNRKKRQSLNQSSDSSSESTKSSQTDTKVPHIGSVDETFPDCKKKNSDMSSTISSEKSATETPVSSPKSSNCDNSEPTVSVFVLQFLIFSYTCTCTLLEIQNKSCWS